MVGVWHRGSLRAEGTTMKLPIAARLQWRGWCVLVLSVLCTSLAAAQRYTLRVVGDDSVPVRFASVLIEGGRWQTTDDLGLLGLGQGKGATLTVNIRRIGFNPAYQKITLPDSDAVITVRLSGIAQTLGAVNVTTERVVRSVEATGFYARWTERQKGLNSGTFIGPDEIEARAPSLTTNLLREVNAIRFYQDKRTNRVAVWNPAQLCPLAVMIDGHRLCPPAGCTGNGGGKLGKRKDPWDEVYIDEFVSPADVAAIEVYPRGGNMPSSAPAPLSDSGCGVILIWTGSRR